MAWLRLNVGFDGHIQGLSVVSVQKSLPRVNSEVSVKVSSMAVASHIFV